MALFEKNTVENLVILMAGILLFNGLVNSPWVGPYLKQYPLIVILVAVMLLIMKDKIANALGG